MKKLPKYIKILGYSLIGLAVVSLVLSLVFNFTYDTASGASMITPLSAYSHFCKFIWRCLIGTAGYTYPTDIWASLSFIIGLLLSLVGVAWIVISIIKKKYIKMLYGLASVAAGFVVSFGFFLAANLDMSKYFEGYQAYQWQFLKEGNALAILVFILAILLCLAFIAFFVLNVLVMFQKGEPAKKDESALAAKKDAVHSDEKKPEPAKEEKAAPAVVEEKKEPVKSEEKPEEKKADAKPADKKGPVTKSEDKKPEAKKPEEKKADEKPAEDKKPEEKKGDSNAPKAYHVSQHESGKWQVKASGSDKALKLFDTQAEAISYARQVAKNQDASIRVHSTQGKIRKA